MKWSPGLAYTIGIIATDGNLSSNGRHINITSKDREIVEHCKAALGVDNTIGRKSRGASREKKYFVLQFGSVVFYRFLLDLGLHPNKSKTLGCVDVPRKYFSDFLRGCIDGDGTIDSFVHPESKHPQLRIRLTSASEAFLTSMQLRIREYVSTQGGWIYCSTKRGKKSVSILTFGKTDAIKILKYMYNPETQYKLTRKYNQASRFVSFEK